MGAKGLARAKVADDGSWTQSPLAKSITPALREAINAATGREAGRPAALPVRQRRRWCTPSWPTCAAPRQEARAHPRVRHGGQTGTSCGSSNPPLFEYDEETDRWAAAHHAFTRPHDECVQYLESDPGKVLCYRYDLVLNGFEIGGGSIRLHDPEVQAKVFRALGISDEDAKAKFGFLLDALKFGAPPHGGIALGMDRLAMLSGRDPGAESIRDVVPSPRPRRAPTS
jgi:aspartyl-tRNA synthetase